MTLVARVLPWTTTRSICWSQPRSCPDNAPLPPAAPIKTHAITQQPGERPVDEKQGETRGKVTEKKNGGGIRTMALDEKKLLCLFWLPSPPLFDTADCVVSTLQWSYKKTLVWDWEQSLVDGTLLYRDWKCWLGAVIVVLLWCSLTESLIHLGWILAEILRSDKAQLCLCDPAHWV